MQTILAIACHYIVSLDELRVGTAIIDKMRDLASLNLLHTKQFLFSHKLLFCITSFVLETKVSLQYVIAKKELLIHKERNSITEMGLIPGEISVSDASFGDVHNGAQVIVMRERQVWIFMPQHAARIRNEIGPSSESVASTWY